MRYVLIAVLLGVTMQVIRSEDSKYQPSEIQSLRLQVRHKDAIIAQKSLEQAQQNFSWAVKLLNEEGEKVRADNKWPEEVKFDADKLEFLVPQPIKVTPKGIEGGK